MNNSRKGNAAELRVAHYKQQRGWLVGSRRHIGGAGDLICSKPGHRPQLIEVKASEEPWENFRPKDREEMLRTAESYDCDALLALSPGAGIPQFLPSRDWPYCPKRGKRPSSTLTRFVLYAVIPLPSRAPIRWHNGRRLGSVPIAVAAPPSARATKTLRADGGRPIATSGCLEAVES